MRNLSFVFLFLSAVSFLVAGFFIYERYYDPQRLAIFGPNDVVVVADISASASAGLPVRLTLPSLGLDLPVIPASVSANHWPTTTQGVSYMVSSALPGAGNSVFYGHNWPRILGTLSQAQVGQQLTITTSDGQVQNYRIQSVEVVKSSAVDILNPSELPRITLYTCAGIFDQNRLVVVAD